MEKSDKKVSGIDIGQFICAVLVMISYLAPFGSFD